MRMPCPSTLLLLLPLLAPIGCAVEEPLLDDELELDEDLELELRSSPEEFGLRPYHGRWEGHMNNSAGNHSHDYEATIVLNPGICRVDGQDVYTAQWDYYNLGLTCISDLRLLGVSVLPGGSRVWTFSDQNRTGPCVDGLVDLAETGQPGVFAHSWRSSQGEVDATGLVERNGLCTPGFGGG